MKGRREENRIAAELLRIARMVAAAGDEQEQEDQEDPKVVDLIKEIYDGRMNLQTLGKKTMKKLCNADGNIAQMRLLEILEMLAAACRKKD